VLEHERLDRRRLGTACPAIGQRADFETNPDWSALQMIENAADTRQELDLDDVSV
jgi:hypothetical protein